MTIRVLNIVRLLLFTAILILPVSAQPGVMYPIGCSFNGSSPMGQGLFPASSHAVQEVQLVAGATGTPVWEIYQGGVPNASATVLQRQIMTPMGPSVQQVPVIVYNTAFMNNAINAYGRWAGIGIIAHECGHHVNMDVSVYGSFSHPWSKELRADAFAGYALAKLGASLQEAQQFQRTIYSAWGSPTHPDSPRRLAAVHQGWVAGGGSGSLMDVSGVRGSSFDTRSSDSDDVVDEPVIEIFSDTNGGAKEDANSSLVRYGFLETALSLIL